MLMDMSSKTFRFEKRKAVIQQAPCGYIRNKLGRAYHFMILCILFFIRFFCIKFEFSSLERCLCCFYLRLWTEFFLVVCFLNMSA